MRLGLKLLQYVLVVVIFLCGAQALANDVAEASDRKRDIAPELLALMPKAVPGHELSWLNGIWYEDCETSAPYISFSASDEGLFALTGPEAKAQAVPPVEGKASANPGERGFTYVTPPKWNDAYLRIKSKDERTAEVELVQFAPDELVWNVTKNFNLEKCK